MRVVQFFPRFGGETKRRKVMFIVGRLKACLIMVALIKRTRWILPRTSYVPFYEISLFLVRTYIFVCRLTAKKNFQTAVINLESRFPRARLTRAPRSIFHSIFNSYVLMKFLPRNAFDFTCDRLINEKVTSKFTFGKKFIGR